MEPEDEARITIQDNVLTISRLNDERDPGMYQCRAENSLKIRYSSAQLRVLGKQKMIKLHVLYQFIYCSFQTIFQENSFGIGNVCS